MGYTQEQIKKYFERIEFNGVADRTSKTLSAIQSAHLEHIPYENIDILNGIALSLDENDLFDKMVTEKRGGYCFEQNGLLLAVLQGLGFEVTQFCGRFILGETGIADRRHRVLRVKADDGVFICDVGVYGESPRKCLRFVENEIQNDGICEYKYIKDDFYGWIECQREQGKDWKNIYGFTTEEWLSNDFVQPSFFCEKHPESAFTGILKAGIFRGKKSLTFIDKDFTVYADAKVQMKKTILSAEETQKVLSENFNLDIALELVERKFR